MENLKIHKTKNPSGMHKYTENKSFGLCYEVLIHFDRDNSVFFEITLGCALDQKKKQRA